MTLSAYRKAPSYANEASLSASPACRPGPLQMPEAGNAPTNATSFTHASYRLWQVVPLPGYEYAAGAKKGMNVQQGVGAISLFVRAFRPLHHVMCPGPLRYCIAQPQPGIISFEGCKAAFHPWSFPRHRPMPTLHPSMRTREL